jgi:adenylate cyclase
MMERRLSQEGLKRRLAGILAADVAGYTRLMREDESATVAALDRCRLVFREKTEVERGRVVDTAGDSVLCIFETATGAVSAALAIQESLAGEQMRFRIGVHLGEVMEKPDGSIYGNGVNLAARMESLAPPGGICVSATVRDQVAGDVADAFVDIGEHRLKNMDAPVRAFAWGDIDAIRAGASDSRKPTIAIAAFESHGDEAEALAGAVAEGIASALSNQTGFQLVAESATPDYVLHARLQVRDRRYRAALRLLDSRTEESFASERFEGDAGDPFEAEDELVFRFYGTTRYAIYDREADRAKRGETISEIEGLLSRAAQLLFQPKVSSYLEARGLIDRILISDPQNFMALAMKAATHMGETIAGFRSVAADDERAAIAAAHEAVRLNPHSDYVHYELSRALLVCERDYAAAEREARRCLEINPVYPLAWMGLGQVLTLTDRAVDGAAHFLKASQANSRWTGNGWAFMFVGLAEFVCGNDAEARDWAIRSDQRQPDTPRNLVILASAAAHAGDAATATEAAERLLDVCPEFRIRKFGNWLFRDPEPGERIVEGLRKAGLPD